jgi:N-acetylmuramic acid 6-phosphate etherase
MLNELTTEARNSRTNELDKMSLHELLFCMNREDRAVPRVVAKVLDKVEDVVRIAVRALRSGGRLIYMGAGTSGRLGVLDAVECVPTFSAAPDQIVGVIAGGEKALTEAVEGAEDSEKLGADDLAALKLMPRDVVVGIAASGRTPQVVGGLKYAGQIGAARAAISCNRGALISRYAEVAVEVETGPEVLTGSTRLKAGTAQKLILNMISTAAMVGLGKVYENLMVDVRPTNEKLVDRSKRIIMEAANVDGETAARYFYASDHNVKVAIIMILTGCTPTDARNRLQKANGFIRQAVTFPASENKNK